MNPIVTNPTIVAIHQYVFLIGTIAALITPLFKSLPSAYAFLQRLAAWGLDTSKGFGARRIPSDAGPVPVKSVTPGPTITSALMTVCISALAGILFAMALGATLVSSTSCLPAKVAAIGGLSVEQQACVLLNESSGEPPAVAATCSIPPEFVKEVEGLILAARRARTMKDGGVK